MKMTTIRTSAMMAGRLMTLKRFWIGFSSGAAGRSVRSVFSLMVMLLFVLWQWVNRFSVNQIISCKAEKRCNNYVNYDIVERVINYAENSENKKPFQHLSHYDARDQQAGDLSE